MQRRIPTHIDQLYWHDGVFEAVTVIAPPNRRAMGALALDVALYPLALDVPFPTASSPKRIPLRVSFGAVTSFGLSCDMRDLFENHGAGNIDVAWLRELEIGRRFVLAMMGGELAINYRSAKVARR